jgi:hypothetical protein
MIHEYRPLDRFESPVREDRCRASVASGGRSMRFHQCARKPVDGERFCRQHDPDAARRRQAEAAFRFNRQLWDSQYQRLLAALGELVMRHRDGHTYCPEVADRIGELEAFKATRPVSKEPAG